MSVEDIELEGFHPEQVNRREVYRYLGYRGQMPDETVTAIVEEVISMLFRESAPKHLYREFPLYISTDGTIDGGCFQTKSRHLSTNLKDCEKIVLFAATLGIGADHLIHRYSRLEMSRAVMLQAAAAAMIESYCDEICTALRSSYEAQGWYLRPRFSPGYGDFPLECQEPLLTGLEAGKRIGIKLTDSFLMMPSKSVTAVMGLSKTPRTCDVRGCEVCEKKDCTYRR